MPPPRVAPLAPVALALMAGVCLDRFATGEAASTGAWLAVAAIAGLVGLGPGGWRGLGTAAVLLAWVALGAGRHHRFWSDLPPDDLARTAAEDARPAWVRGVLVDVLGYRPGTVEEQAGLTRSILAISHVHDDGRWRRASGRALLLAEGDRADLRPGMLVEAAGGLGLVPPPLNPGEFDYRDYLRSQGVRLRFAADGPTGVWPAAGEPPGGPGWAATRALGAVRAWSQGMLARGLRPETAPLAEALLLGRRDRVAPEVNDAFARTGTTHLLAISGLHLQVLAAAFGVALRLLGFSRRSAAATVAAATVAYAGLVGLMPSVVRSAAMTLTYCAAILCDRPARSPNTLAIAALVTLAINPSHLFDVGCQLSFLAVGAIVWGVPPVMARLFPEPDPLTRVERRFEPAWKTARRRLWRWGVEGVVISTVVWLVGLPLAASTFHLVSPVGILLNVPLVPITSVALLAGGVYLGLAAVGLPGAWGAAWACDRLLTLTAEILTRGVAWRWGYAFVPGPPWPSVLAFYVLLGLAASATILGWRGRAGCRVATAALVPPILAWTFGFAPRPWVPTPGADVLAVGHGLAVILDPGGGRATLYDCGRMRDPSVGRRVVAPALWSRGVRALDAVILSHADADHYSGLPDLLERFAVAELVIPVGFEGGARPDPFAADLLADVRRRGVPIRAVTAGASWRAGPLGLTVVHPPADSASETDNGRSLVLDVAGPGGRLLLTGDLDGPGLAELPDRLPPGPVAAMLAPHHGARSANGRRLYDRLAPAVVVASQRAPAPGVRDPLVGLDRPLLRTWQVGAVRLDWTGPALSAQGARPAQNGTPDDGAGGD